MLLLQEKDLKQYMEDCGNIMNMANVKVGLYLSMSRCIIRMSTFTKL